MSLDLDVVVPAITTDPELHGAVIDLDDVGVEASDGTVVLAGITTAVRPGELVAVVGVSGAGKSTLLRAIAGDVLPDSGRVLVDGVDTRSDRETGRTRLGYVPQDDVLSRDLPLGRTLRYAARLRLPRGTSRYGVSEAVDRALRLVELEDVAHVPVGRLSGGQRRRASIAVELIADPSACVLDEPTSGLDPGTAWTVMAELRGLSGRGRSIVFSTHHAADLEWCDRILAVAPGGRIVFDGTLEQARAATAADDVDRVLRALLDRRADAPGIEQPTGNTVVPVDGSIDDRSGPRAPFRRSPARRALVRQWWALTSRTVDSIVHNRLTLAIMLGSPTMVIVMFAILFRPGAFDPSSPSTTSAIMITFWIAFGGFFFGLTYGLLQVCSEFPLMRRERRAGVGAGVQIAAKLAALAPVLLLIDVAMLVILRRLDRLPAISAQASMTLVITLALDAIAALALGLLASAAVSSPAQASLALPMLCFPAVLFSGAILPVPVMAPVGRAISSAMPDRWAFEAIGRDLALRELFAGDPGPLGAALLDEYGRTWTMSNVHVWLLLAAFAVTLSGAAWLVLRARIRPVGAR